MTSPSPHIERLLLAGGAGNIEVVIHIPETPNGVAVIAHPHPLFSGTMDNKVVTTLVKACNEMGLAAVRFNFRGVGASEGIHDEGRGEVEDTVTVIDYVRSRFAAGTLILAGFSFGGAVMLRVNQRVSADGLILIAPAMTQRFGGEVPPDANPNTLVIHGENDETVPLASVMDWARPQGLPIVVFPGGEHFFHGQLTILKKIVTNWLR